MRSDFYSDAGSADELLTEDLGHYRRRHLQEELSDRPSLASSGGYSYLESGRNWGRGAESASGGRPADTRGSPLELVMFACGPINLELPNETAVD
jgi:hypothetical protein